MKISEMRDHDPYNNIPIDWTLYLNRWGTLDPQNPGFLYLPLVYVGLENDWHLYNHFTRIYQNGHLGWPRSGMLMSVGSPLSISSNTTLLNSNFLHAACPVIPSWRRADVRAGTISFILNLTTRMSSRNTGTRFVVSVFIAVLPSSLYTHSTPTQFYHRIWSYPSMCLHPGPGAYVMAGPSQHPIM